MSLFGDFPDDPPSQPIQSKSTLFDDGRPASKRNSSGLFADDMNAANDSPWAMPTPKKAGRAQMIRNLLPASNVPEFYVDIYDNVLRDGNGMGAGMSLDGVKKVLEASGLGSDPQSRILSTVLPGGEDTVVENGVGRAEFNVLLALVGLAQEGDEVGLDGVDERRSNLPIPKLRLELPPRNSKYTTERDTSEGRDPAALRTATQEEAAGFKSSTKPQLPGKQPSFTIESDPWGSPDLHRGHNHAATNGFSSALPEQRNGSLPQRTTSAITTTSTGREPSTGGAPARPNSGGAGGWGGSDSFSSSTIGNNSIGGGFGSSGGNAPGGNDAPELGQSVPAPRAGSGVEEVVTITSLPEKEGVFMFQHRNYEVSSTRRNSKVIRRYSDFVWLLDCLHKRYPFRQLPLLPPKRVAINGNYLAADATFVEKRRRGLVRFANALVRHPVLSQEQLVIMFLTVPTELAVWRKQATISVQEEFIGKQLPPTLEESLPANLEEMFSTVRSGVRRSAETYINLANMMERLTKRNEGMAAEHLRFSLALQSLTEVSTDTYAVDTNDVPMLNEGLAATAKHMSASQSLLEDEAKAWDEGVLEDLKRQRDSLVTVRDMFDRRDRFDKDNIPQLEKRIKSSENKLTSLRGRPEGVGKPGDIEKVEDSILKDKQSIVTQHARHIFVKECVKQELDYFQSSQYVVSRLHQDWAQERVKYAELQADNWRALAEEVEGMPLSAA